MFYGAGGGSALALLGILKYSHYKNWKFPDGDRYFRTYSKHLERWSQYVLEEIRRYPRIAGEPFQYLSENYQKAMTDASEFLSTTSNFLDASLNEVQNRIKELEASGGATVELSHKEIQDGLVQLRSLLTEMKAEE